MTNLPTDILMQLVRARYTCLVQLRDLGRRQLELIDQGNVTGLLDLLTIKQKPLSDIQRVEKALDPYRTQDPEKRQWPSADQRAACWRDWSRSATSCLRRSSSSEKRCEETMTRKRDNTAMELQRLRAAGQAHGAYLSPARRDAGDQPTRPEFGKVTRTMSQAALAVDPTTLDASADLQTILAAWHTATLRLEQTHTALRDEVQQLTAELEIKNRELGPQEPSGRPWADGLARGARGPQQPRAGNALLEPAPPPARRATPRASTCWRRSTPVSGRWT